VDGVLDAHDEVECLGLALLFVDVVGHLPHLLEGFHEVHVIRVSAVRVSEQVLHALIVRRVIR
jgi:hypothetical protein